MPKRQTKNAGYRLAPGKPIPLGSQWDGMGTNFSLYSAHAEKVELCLFDSTGMIEIQRLSLPDPEHQIWSAYIPELAPGSIYGYRVYGPYQPELGLRFNHHKLLLDPYARQLAGNFVWSDLHYGYKLDSHEQDLSFDTRDNSKLMYKAVVKADAGVSTSPRPHLASEKTVIYEAHVRGMTMQHPALKPAARGTFLGMGHQDIIDYLKALGITTLELLPVQGFLDEHFLEQKGLKNYWGYNSLSFFAPHQAYLQKDNPLEFRAMVDSLHDAGIEVILDVVFNHTAEGSRLGPTLSFKGIDNLTYYRVQAENPRYYINDTGCGNTLNIANPVVLRLVMDALRYWVSVMGVDGFRFDLAPIMGREHYGFDQGSGFFDALYQDPVLAGVRLIAEPWDIGPGGYQLGNFPPDWSEWNDRYRDTIRRFWRGDPGVLPEFARRLHGSSDIFEHAGRRPDASINFITSHDGFSLYDMVSYKDKHNEANLEDNRDGHSENHSDNYGVEGPTLISEINEVRRRQRRNLLTSLILSQGIPMLTAGDERCRTQSGNNNAYCQDNELNWINWNNTDTEVNQLQAFTTHLLSLKQKYPWIWQRQYVHDSSDPDKPVILWFNPDGEIMQPSHWGQYQTKTLGYLVGVNVEGKARRMFAMFNASQTPLHFKLPFPDQVPSWHLLLDTSSYETTAGYPLTEISGHYPMLGFSTVVLLDMHEISNPTAQESLL